MKRGEPEKTTTRYCNTCKKDTPQVKTAYGWICQECLFNAGGTFKEDKK